jgi:hypothetical protein
VQVLSIFGRGEGEGGLQFRHTTRSRALSGKRAPGLGRFKGAGLKSKARQQNKKKELKQATASCNGVGYGLG